jgi:CRP/FNR family transcriptional regulator
MAGQTTSPTMPVPCTRCGSRIAGICAALDIAGLDEMSHETRRSAVHSHETLFREGDPANSIVMLVSGMAKLSRLMPDGRQQVLGFRFAGDIMGFTSGKAHAADAEMLTEGVICRMTRPQLEGMLSRFPAAQRRMMDMCVQELALAQDQLVTVGRRHAEQRVAAFLLSLSVAARRRGERSQHLEMPMTRAEIGDLLGLALETVSRAFTALRKRGLVIETAGHRVELPDLEALALVADGV